MGARLRARTAARDRAADGLDQLGRHAPAGAYALRHGRGGDRLLRAPWHRVPDLSFQAAGAPHHVLRRQFRLQPARSLDPLTRPHCRRQGQRSECSRHVRSGAAACWFPVTRLVAQMAALPTAAIDAIIKKKSGLAMVLQKPPRNPARMSPGNVAANQNPIIMDRMRAGAIFETKASPTGARWSSPMVAMAK